MAGGVFTGGGATVVVDPPPIAFVKVFRETGEPKGWIRDKAQRVALQARVLAPKRTGALMNSIRITQNYIPGRFVSGYSVYSNSPYGYYVHDGTDPSIREVSPGYMKFTGTNAFAGKRIRTRTVNHPGTPANEFLEDALYMMAV